jgi:HK97 family phage major capsid protein
MNFSTTNRQLLNLSPRLQMSSVGRRLVVELQKTEPPPIRSLAFGDQRHLGNAPAVGCTGQTIAAPGAQDESNVRPGQRANQHVSYMKKYLRKYKHLTSTLAVAVAAFALLSPVAAFCVLALWQLLQIAMSPRRVSHFYNMVLSPEQLREFEGLVLDLKDYSGIMKEFHELKKRNPAALSDLVKLTQSHQQLEGEVTKLRRAQLARCATPGSAAIGRVSDDCARYFGALALAVGVRRGQITGQMADMSESLCREIFGMNSKAALTSSDIPLPTEYSGQVVELVGLYGMARKYGTVFPLGAGAVKLPRLKTDTTFGLIAGSGTVTEVSPQTEWVTFTAEKFGGLVRLPTEMSEDSIVDIGQFMARYAARNIARAEDYNYFASTGAGSGVNGSVEGLCFSTITNSKVTQMAGTKTKYSDATLANFRALRAVPDSAAMRNGAYYLHPSFEQLLASFNTAGDRPYNPIAQLANPDKAQPFIAGPTLDGFPVRWVDTLPAYSTGANAEKVFALFGDLSFQYLGVRGGIRFDTSMEAGFATDEILIRCLERFTIGLMATGAVAGLETAAS